MICYMSYGSGTCISHLVMSSLVSLHRCFPSTYNQSEYIIVQTKLYYACLLYTCMSLIINFFMLLPLVGPSLDNKSYHIFMNRNIEGMKNSIQIHFALLHENF